MISSLPFLLKKNASSISTNNYVLYIFNALCLEIPNLLTTHTGQSRHDSSIRMPRFMLENKAQQVKVHQNPSGS